MAGQEFQESEVIFPDHHIYQDFEEKDSQTQESHIQNNGRNGKKKKQKKPSCSVPVNIPSSVLQCAEVDDYFEEDYDGDELVPPHVILGRRLAGKMAFSVCTGIGRTLKGRDLSEVRNSILRMTGFLET